MHFSWRLTRGVHLLLSASCLQASWTQATNSSDEQYEQYEQAPLKGERHFVLFASEATMKI